MFPSHSPEQAAIAAQLSLDLAEYDEGIRRVVRGQWEPAFYRHLADQFDRMQMQAGMLPSLAGTWSELLISRVELTHALWSAGPTDGKARIVSCHARHRLLIARAQRECMGYVAQRPD
jgi:hypothetical protein